MSWITIDEARENLRLWLEAERAVAIKGQSYRIGTRSLTSVNLSEIAARIKYWRGQVEELEAAASGANMGGVRIFRAVPRDF